MSARYLVLIGLVGAMLAMAASARGTERRWGQWENSLKPKGEAAAEIALAVGGETEYVVVIPDSPTTQEQKAAEDLAQWLGEMTGAEFPIVSDAQRAQNREISVGRTSRLTQASLPVASEDLGDEGYGIAVQGERLFLIGGKKRGPIYAAIAFLEEDLGCRWYTRYGVNRIPRRPTVRVGVVARSYVPALQNRDPYYHDAFDAIWSLRNRTNAPGAAVPEEWGGHMTYALGSHSFNTLIPPGEYKNDHPEYFGPNQPCLTNPEVLRIATENTLRILRENPNAELISVSQTDGGGYCTCEKCQALDRAEGSHAGTLISFVNQVAEAVEKEFPDVLVSTLAYTYSVILPKTVRPRDNIAIRLCSDTCMWWRPFVSVKDDRGPVPLEWSYWDMADNPETLSFKGFLDEWSAVHDTIHIWDYVVNFSHYLAPMPNMDVIRDNIRYFVAHKVKGIMTQGAWQSPGSERELMRAWVIAKLLWDPSRDVWELMQDFIWGYYGKAAPAIVEYNQLLRRTAEEHRESIETISGDPPSCGGIRYPMDAEFLSEEFLEGAEAIFVRAKKLAENEEILHRVELAHLPIIYVKIMRGPEFSGGEYLPLIDEFERIARREGITHLEEGPPDLDTKIAKWRDEVRILAELATLKEEVSITPLRNEWRFAVDPDDVGVSEKWYSDSFNDSGWAVLRNDLGVKGWEAQGFPSYDGFGWYRQSFTAPPAAGHKKMLLYFGAVDEQAWIYLNGETAFEHTCASTGLTLEQLWARPFLLDATDHLALGQTNTLAVRVHDQGMMGGVWKPLYLIGADRDIDAQLFDRFLAERIEVGP